MSSPKEEKNEENIVLFSRENEENAEEIWDDTALIRAYEKSVRKIKKAIKDKSHILDTSEKSTNADNVKRENVSKENPIEKESNKSDSESNLEFEWKVGDFCTAVYTEDGLSYPATITKIFKDKKKRNKCIIKYLHYLNEEEKYLNELYEYEELDENDQEDDHNNDREENSKQEQKTEASKMSSNKKEINDFFEDALPNMPVPPMLPYELMSRLSFKSSEKSKSKKSRTKEEQEEDEAILNSMLMSWYMSGYHTGFYYGLNHGKKRFS
jgi:survival motor neuron protein